MILIANPIPGHFQLSLEALVEAGVLRHELPVARLQRAQLLPHRRQLGGLLGGIAFKLKIGSF